MKTKLLLFIIFMVLANSGYAQWTIQTVPNPKKLNNTYVANPDNILSVNDVVLLNSLIQSADDSGKIQIAVVMLKSIGNSVPKEFATSLFNYWGVGEKNVDNGLLILFVMDQRRVEFETGYGIESIITDAISYQVQQEYMVPEFKAGNYGLGIIKGVSRVIEIAGGPSEIIQSQSTVNEYSGSNTTETNYSERSQKRTDYHSFLGFYIRATLFMSFIFIVLFCITMFQDDYFKRYQTMRIFQLYIWFLLFPLPFVGFYFWTKKLLDSWRNTPRISPKTGRLMRKLSEDIDDQYLEKGQVTEEQVKSIDYDVWVSEEPGDILILAYKRWFSAYSACPSCKFKTYYKEYDRVIRSATYSSSGEGERKYTCKNCNHSKTTRYTIPRKTKSSSSSYRSGSSGSSSSFGGGRSGGGGSGSSW